MCITGRRIKMEQDSLLQRYRRDRRKLLEFLLSSGLIEEVRTPSGSTSLSEADFDKLSADYILHCIKSGGIVDVSEASKKYHAESAHPIMIHSKLGDSYFLTSDPDIAGSPPRRVPPSTSVSSNNHASSSSSKLDSFDMKSVETHGDDYGLKQKAEAAAARASFRDSGIPSLGLPTLKTGLSDDDLRESAYELLLASMYFSGVEMFPVEDRKKEKNSKFLSRLKSKREKPHSRPQLSERHSELVDTIRAQMQISEAMDACIRRNMVQLTARRTCGQIDLPQISLELLIGIFRSDFPNEKSYIQWKSRQVNILEELLYFSAELPETERVIIKSCLAKIRDTKEWDVAMSPAQRVEIISSIRQVASKAFFQQGKFGLQNETYYWQAAYHLNIRLYEKLLNGVFDILDEGQLIEEADAILSLIKLTWSTLGITDKLHDALYGWALVQQFVDTAEGTLLEHAVLQLQRVVSAKEDDCNEGQYMNSITCLKERNGSQKKLNLVQSIFLSIGTWCDSKLQDYHLHFSEKPVHFKKVVALASTIGMLSSADCADKVIVNASREKIKRYVERSVEAAIGRVAITVLESKERTHPLALLANQLRLIADRELKIFFPVLRQWSPESMMISVQKLHQFFGERLIPFLKGVSSLSEDARSVLAAAYALDNELGQLYTSALEEQKVQHSPRPYLDHYQIEKVSGPLIIDWVIGQHTHILEWTRRALELEDWEPLSFHKRQAASIVEVFRILEETVDQLFGMNLPLDITHLQALLSIVFHSLDAYLQRVLNQLVEKNHLYPSAPPLTRYTETAIPLIKKRLNEYKILDDIMIDRLNELTIPKLCIRLNTLQYIQKQVGVLEDDIRNSWAAVRPSLNQTQAEEEPVEILESDSLTHNETVDELFGTTFNIIRDTAKDIGLKTCDLIGTRVVFWDLRDAFLFHLYRGNVESTRLENFLPDFDTVLDNVCGVIDDAVRDVVVLSIYKASLEGFVWVLLDGGPCRAFSDSDIILMEEDLLTLKEFFIADGEGLPESLVEQEAKFAERILHMFSLQTETVIQMLMTASELISMGLDSDKQGHTNLGDAHTLIRVLCHKKDREASKFLKVQYQLPMSSDYDDTPLVDSTSRLPRMSEVLKRSTSIRWNKKRQSSFKSMKKKIQGATNEIRNVGR
ncbi:protein unc-13 homolog isoform X1 [Gossypium arboreum]|uniref:Protein unc-13 homolog n=2 Tax=Gossypium arboreum TaxID=29729 RepID=A0ABR0R6H7_GOSAR|nr:protein unc-13 homolog isoform X1 [Gossypium arboreum]KAK5847109.1 hypothetical protein PVK06_003411 [Gossypium arboreum]